jgi:DNA-binding CsgD family transcriptional regulator
VPSPVTFCTTCCAEQAAAQGDLSGAERQLHVAVIEMTASPRAARCIPPAAKLADLLVLQGRLEEAQRTVGDADDSTSLVVRARIAQALGEPAVAATLAKRAARREGPQAAAYTTLVQAHIDGGDVDAAREALRLLEDVVSRGADIRGRSQVALSRGRLALAEDDMERAEAAFEETLDVARGTVCLEAATACLELARMRVADRPSVARLDAKAALSMFETLGATVLADASAAVLRSLGDRSRVGPKNVGVLSKREEEVLRLVGQGLTNAEIASRLFISSKTAGNHVSAILAKLGVRSRTEAVAYLATRSDPS